MLIARSVHPLPGEAERKERLLNLVYGFSSRRVLIVGDLIADEFIYGEVARSFDHQPAGGGEIGDRGPARQEGLEIGLHRRHRRLLQHDLAEPDAVGIGRLARQRPPGQPAPMAVVPGEQPRGDAGSR